MGEIDLELDEEMLELEDDSPILSEEEMDEES